jgi:hypothetical protein
VFRLDTVSRTSNIGEHGNVIKHTGFVTGTALEATRYGVQTDTSTELGDPPERAVADMHADFHDAQSALGFVPIHPPKQLCTDARFGNAQLVPSPTLNPDRPDTKLGRDLTAPRPFRPRGLLCAQDRMTVEAGLQRGRNAFYDTERNLIHLVNTRDELTCQPSVFCGHRPVLALSRTHRCATDLRHIRPVAASHTALRLIPKASASVALLSPAQ